jgi:hypothetical protein
MNRGYNVTMLEELPDLEEIEDRNFQGGAEPISNDKLKKFIRGNHIMDPQAGMESRNVQKYNTQPQLQPQQFYRDIPQSQLQHEPVLNCIDVAKHIQNCPICSRFYNTDKTVYIIIIVLLIILCTLLLKKILNI